MALSAFDDKSRPPEPGEVKAVLGPSAALWEQLVSHVAATYAPMTELWSFAGARFGWSLRLKRGDRVILYLTPQAGTVLVGVVLGEKAVQAARRSDLPPEVLELIDSARPYAEGRGIRLTVTSPGDLAAVEKLAAAKMAR